MEQKVKHLATIQLNGQTYNARTGTLVGSSTDAASRTVSDILPVSPTRHTARTLRPSKQVHKSPERGHTLMRRAVKKPAAPILSPAIVPINTSSGGSLAETGSILRYRGDITRSKRASHTPKSSLVSRFGDISAAPVNPHNDHGPMRKHLAQMDVVPAPSHTHEVHATEKPHHYPKNANEKLISAGLSSSHSHETAKHRKPKLRHRVARRVGLGRRATNLAASGLAILLLGAFVAYQRIPNLAVRYASMKAGVNASLPGYHPAAFAVNDSVKYSPGEVAVSYKSNTDDRSYTVTQKNTSWDNSTLEQHLKEEGGRMPQSFAQDKNTIYIQNLGNRVKASVIIDGVLKNITGDASLNTDQIIKIAQSM